MNQIFVLMCTFMIFGELKSMQGDLKSAERYRIAASILGLIGIVVTIAGAL